MNTTGITGNWNEQKSKLNQKFSILTDIDLKFENAKNEYVKYLCRNSKTKNHSK
jgi:hypothetical protein